MRARQKRCHSVYNLPRQWFPKRSNNNWKLHVNFIAKARFLGWNSYILLGVRSRGRYLRVAHNQNQYWSTSRYKTASIIVAVYSRRRRAHLEQRCEAGLFQKNQCRLSGLARTAHRMNLLALFSTSTQRFPSSSQRGQGEMTNLHWAANHSRSMPQGQSNSRKAPRWGSWPCMPDFLGTKHKFKYNYSMPK